MTKRLRHLLRLLEANAAGYACPPPPLLPLPASPQSSHDAVLAHVEANAAGYATTAQQIWDLAEVGYQEVESGGPPPGPPRGRRLRRRGWRSRTGSQRRERPARSASTAPPAEEGGGGKVYMVRGGLFGDVDAVLHWHPGSRNSASPSTSLANKSRVSQE